MAGASVPHLKRPAVAFVLSFVVPGAGLWYLGRWWLGLVNLLAVTAVGLFLLEFFHDDLMEKYPHYIALAVLAGSGGLAHALCLRDNLRSRIPDSKSQA